MLPLSQNEEEEEWTMSDCNVLHLGMRTFHLYPFFSSAHHVNINIGEPNGGYQSWIAIKLRIKEWIYFHHIIHVKYTIKKPKSS